MESISDEELEASAGEIEQWLIDLAKLRAPFPEERIEKLPKPTFKDAWKDQPKSHCDICGGYHSTRNVIHLDYVGHANCTDRLLSVDPMWNWEPLAYDDRGLPLFDRFDGLWIKLTICGVTRIGYGDGGSIKEVIGDAIRNAAMRFGVALDLWAKVDLHEGVNPATPVARRQEQGEVRGQRGGRGTQSRGNVATTAAPRPNQAALDALEVICRKHGYSTQYCIDRFFTDYDIELKDAAEELILAFADILVSEATAEPADRQQPVDGGGDDAGGRGNVDETVQPSDPLADDPPF